METAISTPHDHGCAQLGSDTERTERTLVNLAANPNIAGTVVVGLGCEELQSDWLAATIAERDRPVRELSIQGIGGTDKCLERGVELTTHLVESAESSTQSVDLAGRHSDRSVRRRRYRIGRTGRSRRKRAAACESRGRTGRV